MKYIASAWMILLSISVSAGTVETLSQKIMALDQQIAQVSKELQEEKKNNEALVSEVQKSEQAWKDAYASAEKLNALNVRLHELSEQHSKLCREWKIAYASSVDSLLTKAQNEKSPQKKGEVGKILQSLQKQNVKLCAENSKIGVSQEWRSISVEPYDGPQEVNQKMELLQEISREIQIHLARLDQQLQEFQKERKTKERAEEFIQESTLFSDHVSVRRGGVETTNSATGGEIDKGLTGTEIFTRGELYGKEQQEQFELQHQQKKKELLLQQKEVKQKLEELHTRAQQLEIR